MPKRLFLLTFATMVGILGAMFPAPAMAVSTPGASVRVTVNEALLSYATFESGDAVIGEAFVFPGATVESVLDLGVTEPMALELFFNVNVSDPSDFNGTFCLHTGFFCGGPDVIATGGINPPTTAADRIDLFIPFVSGENADDFPFGALLVVTFLDGLTGDPLSALTNGETYRVAMSLESVAAPIPLPAAGWLFVVGLATAMRLRHHRG